MQLEEDGEGKGLVTTFGVCKNEGKRKSALKHHVLPGKAVSHKDYRLVTLIMIHMNTGIEQFGKWMEDGRSQISPRWSENLYINKGKRLEGSMW